MSLHGDLLRQAQQLAHREPKRPRQASLRRSVSASYYGLFHLLVDDAVTLMVTGPDRGGLRDSLARAFSHGTMKVVAEEFSRGSTSSRIRSALDGQILQPQLIRVAEAFVNLQQARHEADYNRARRFTREEALDLYGEARQAFANWKAVRRAVQADVFLVALLAYHNMRT